MQSRVVVVRADRSPMDGVSDPGPHQTYRNPRVSVESRDLGYLDPDEIRVEMIYAGLCGTDLHLVEQDAKTGYIRSSAPASIPPGGRVVGHEGVGRAIAVGSHVRHVAPGDIVTFESIIVCHFCDVCRRGQFNQCRRALLLGLEKDGLFGTVVDVPAMLTHDVGSLASTEAGLRSAACVEPAGVAYVACESTRVGGGDEVVVFGGGPIGFYAAMLSKVVFGASRVHLVEPVRFRRELGRRWSDQVYDVEEFFADPPAVNVVIEASGTVDNVRRVFRRVAPNGRVALLARSGAPLVLDAIDHLITNGISLVGSRGHLCGAFAKIINLCENGRIALADDVVTRVVEGPEELAALLQTPRTVLDENCKVLVRLGGNGAKRTACAGRQGGMEGQP